MFYVVNGDLSVVVLQLDDLLLGRVEGLHEDVVVVDKLDVPVLEDLDLLHQGHLQSGE